MHVGSVERVQREDGRQSGTSQAAEEEEELDFFRNQRNGHLERK